MVVYNIRKEKYAYQLIASGIANRWNKEEEFFIYAGGSIALSVLELLAHRSGIHMGQGYRMLSIQLDLRSKDMLEIPAHVLPKDWKSIKSYPILQEIGSDWYRNQKSLALKVPSALVPWEHSYIINTRHPLFQEKVSLLSVEDFDWDDRLF
ncbi:RES family NAD+ phosphorylase [Aquiflexum sp.]|uniref:RES family NAD+ phosphorylase n=1 Tax=Aquiflexum sp. TaxID=1872584 RepID=UPI003593BAE3